MLRDALQAENYGKTQKKTDLTNALLDSNDNSVAWKKT
jgi:hypothetical protein